MSCLANCNDCNCEELDVCQETEVIEENLKSKVKILKDFICIIATTSCPSLAKILSKYAYYLWCLLRDFMNILVYLIKMVRCQEEKLSSIANFLNEMVKGNIEFKLYGKNSVGTGQWGTATQNVTVDKEGNFSIKWTMVSLDVLVGTGTITGKVNHEYNVDDKGVLQAIIKNIRFDKIKYTFSGNRGVATLNKASFKINGLNNEVIFKKDYNPFTSFEESINKTITYNTTKPLEAGSSVDIELFDTLDTWESSPTTSRIFLGYKNNNSQPPLNLNTCDPCEDGFKESTPKPVEDVTDSSVSNSQSTSTSSSETADLGDKETIINSITGNDPNSQYTSQSATSNNSSETYNNQSGGATNEPTATDVANVSATETANENTDV